MKKIISTLITFLLTFQLTPISVLANEKENKNESKVIAIVDGIEITENDIDENGLINNSIFSDPNRKKINDNKENIIQPRSRYSIPSTLYVKKGRNALMIKKLGAPRFNQQTDTYFLTPSSAKSFAYKLTSSSNLSIVASSILSITLGAVKNSPVGTYFTIAQMLSGVKMNTLNNSIFNIANQNKSVEVRIIKTNLNYKPIYYVNTWNGTTIKTNLTNSGSAREKLHFYKTN